MAVVDRARVAAALPGYVLGTELGAGAFGLVLAGRHAQLDRQVAIKVLVNAEPSAAADFRAEARLLSRLDHPHIVRTYDYVARGDLCLSVMELLGGGTLAQRRIRPDGTCAVFLALADALGAAHASGVLHRDIKPANVLFSDTGVPKLADFGISKVIEGSASTASRVIGTPKYMAPEQITGGRLSPATDLYALSAVLYELLSGTSLVPPKVPLPVLLRHHLVVVPDPPPDVPAPLAEVVLRGLQKRPEDRHPDARAFAADLARAATKVFGRGWLERAGVPVRISDDVRALTTSRLAPLALVGAGGHGGARQRPLAWAGVGATAGLLAVTLLAGAAAGGGIGWAVRGPSAAPATSAPPAPPWWQPAGLKLGTITSVFGAGDGDSGDGGMATFAEISSYGGLAIDARTGGIYLPDYSNNRVRRVDRDGVITTVAGTGIQGFTGDGGPATKAELDSPTGVAFGLDGSLYIADGGNNRVRRVDPKGVITTVAGADDVAGWDGRIGDDGPYSRDGVAATKAKLHEPNSLAVDGAGNLYISDGGNYRIRRVDRAGVITTVVGNGEIGDTKDGGPATEAALRYPMNLVIAPDGSLYFSEQHGYRIRRVSPKGVLTTVAGSGTEGYSGDGGRATSAQISDVGNAIAVASDGTVYFTDDGRVRKVDPKGVITTIAGTGDLDSTGDGGPATEAAIELAAGLALDETQGLLYIFDSVAGRLRAVRVTPEPCAQPCPSPTATPSVTATPRAGASGGLEDAAAGPTASIPTAPATAAS